MLTYRDAARLADDPARLDALLEDVEREAAASSAAKADRAARLAEQRERAQVRALLAWGRQHGVVDPDYADGDPPHEVIAFDAVAAEPALLAEYGRMMAGWGLDDE